MTREQVVEFLKSNSPGSMRASNAPQEFKPFVKAVHAAIWDGDEQARSVPAAISLVMRQMFPVETADRKGSENCPRCGGSGYIRAFRHRANGRCLHCNA